MDTPNYIKSLLIHSGKKPTTRRAWGIDLEMVWLPFFTATNTVGDTAIPHDALGAPLRLAVNPDGSVKFSKTGKPVIRVVKELADSVRMVRDNFTAGLVTYAGGVLKDNPEGYKAQIELSREAGAPIQSSDREKLDKAFAEAIEQGIAEAQVKAKARSNKRVAVTA